MSQKNKRKQLEDELIQANEKHILSLEERCEMLTKENEAQKQYLKNRELEIENLMQKYNTTKAEVDLIKEKTEDRWVKGLEERYEKMLLDNKQLKEEVAMLKQKYVVIRQNMPGYDFT
jgi:predicted RNase H-like nuclease (RuvC/YqgF family)